jgi:hypothetical protein
MTYDRPNCLTRWTAPRIAVVVLLLPFIEVSATNVTAQAADGSAPRSNIAVTATAAPNASNSEGKPSIVTFTVTVLNDGPGDAQGVLLEAISSSGVLARLGRHNFRASNGVRCHDKILVCEIGDLAAQHSVEIQLVTEVTAAPPAAIGIEFRIASETIDPIPFDNHYYSSAFLPGDPKEGERK